MPLNRKARTWLTESYAGDVTFEEPMANHTSFKVGGPADALVRPKKRDDLVRLVRWASEHGITYMPIGAGSNILVRDSGIRGIVILLDGCLQAIAEKNPASGHPVVVAGAGVKLPALCAYALKHGFKGFNFILGIPGTVGGGLRVNAGAGGRSMGDVVETVGLLMPGGSIRTLQKTDLHFSYRNLDLPPELTTEPGSTPIILEADFCLKQAGKPGIRQEARQILKLRNAHQPWTAPSAGCIFKNPVGNRSAGQLIDMAGLKGKRIGDAQVSPKHANFIVNRGQATAGDILALMDLIRTSVYERYRIKLEAEVRIVG